MFLQETLRTNLTTSVADRLVRFPQGQRNLTSQRVQQILEFAKRMDKDLPFYYWTVNERFQDEELPSFDECPEFDDVNIDARNHPLRLHRLRINQREDGSVLIPGRAILPARHRGTLRHRMHRPEMGAPPVPYHMRIN